MACMGVVPLNKKLRVLIWDNVTYTQSRILNTYIHTYIYREREYIINTVVNHSFTQPLKQ
jgi:hypothetical protein